MSFAQAVKSQDAVTTNGMMALQSTMDANVDLFFKIGASRGKSIISEFIAAHVENRDIALRIAQWARDVRGGAGERQLYRDILNYLENADEQACRALVVNTPEIGRWDDLFVLKQPAMRNFAFSLIKVALDNKNQICAKWCPRKGKDAEALRAFLGYSPKRYRKTLVTLTNVVETKMCAKDWDNINFSQVPSVAAARYRTAFRKNAEKNYTAYAESLSKGEATINAGAVYPYDVLRSVLGSGCAYANAAAVKSLSKVDRQVILAQWNALENFVGSARILPMVDVSGSMSCPVGGSTASKLTCMDVAVSLGLYLAEMNTGAFRDTFLTFTTTPALMTLKGDVLEKLGQMYQAVGYDTNLELAFERVLEVAVRGKVAHDDMPGYILILSDMQFNKCMANPQATAIDMIRKEYEEAGYKAPRIVFWNINAYSNVPVAFNELDVALVSGFSPSILKSVLKAENFSPQGIMLESVMNDRYAVNV